MSYRYFSTTWLTVFYSRQKLYIIEVMIYSIIGFPNTPAVNTVGVFLFYVATYVNTLVPKYVNILMLAHLSLSFFLSPINTSYIAFVLTQQYLYGRYLIYSL